MVYKNVNYFNVNYSSYFIYKGVKRKRCQTCTACVREDWKMSLLFRQA